MTDRHETTRWRLSDGRIMETREPWYLASCDGCGWVGSTEECPRDEEYVICPHCYRDDADCGAVAKAAQEIADA